MIILDTNVVSELMRAEPSAAVMRWIGEQPVTALFTTALTEAEIHYGLALLPAGKRQSQLTDAARGMFAEDFAGRILPFDSDAARAYATLAAQRRRSGHPISQFDAQIGGIARSRGARLATRNVRDFEGCGLEVIDPWQAN